MSGPNFSLFPGFTLHMARSLPCECAVPITRDRAHFFTLDVGGTMCFDHEMLAGF